MSNYQSAKLSFYFDVNQLSPAGFTNKRERKPCSQTYAIINTFTKGIERKTNKHKIRI